MSRPRRAFGAIAQRVLDYARGRHVTMYDVQRDLCLSRRAASVALYNLRAAGAAIEVGRVMHPSARRPVTVITAAPC